MKEYVLNGIVYFSQTARQSDKDLFLSRLNKIAIGINIKAEDESNSIRLDYCGNFIDIDLIEIILKTYKPIIRGLGIEVTQIDLPETVQNINKNNVSFIEKANEISWIYVLSKEDRTIRKEPGMIMYRHKAFSEAEQNFIRNALESYSDADDKVKLSEQIMEKIYDMDAMLESYPI